MKQQVTNFGRFFSAFNKLEHYEDPEQMKKQFVLQYTAGRTDSLRGMTIKEYSKLCEALENLNGARAELRYNRSVVLRLMQGLEVDTTDWAQINDFCRHPRIAGKAFRQLSIDELRELAVKLRSIKRKGWHRDNSERRAGSPRFIHNIPYMLNLTDYGQN